MKKYVSFMLAVLVILSQLGTAIAAPESPYQAQQRSSSGKTTLVVDAQLIVPTPSAWPVIEVARRAFTQTEADAFVASCYDGRDYLGDATFKEVEGIESLFPESSTVGFSLEGAQMTWTDGIGRERSDSYLSVSNSYLGSALVDARMQYARTHGNEEIGFYTAVPYAYSDATSPLVRQAKNNHYTPEEAQELAEKAVATFAPELTLSASAIIQPDQLTADTEGSEGYSFYFTRAINGVHVTHTGVNGASSVDPPDALIEGTTDLAALKEHALQAFEFEIAYVLVSDTGLYTIHWISPYEMKDALDENAALLPFEDIASAAQMLLLLEYSALEPRGDEVIVCIDRIELGYVRTRIKGFGNRYQLTPAWNFFGGVELVSGDERNAHYDANQSLLTLDAQTGLMIELEYGL